MTSNDLSERLDRVEEAVRLVARRIQDGEWLDTAGEIDALLSPLLPNLDAAVEGDIPAHREVTNSTDFATANAWAEMAALEPNWNSYDGAPIDPRAIAKARALVDVFGGDPEIDPSPRGNVVLTWRLGRLRIAVDVGADVTRFVCVERAEPLLQVPRPTVGALPPGSSGIG